MLYVILLLINKQELKQKQKLDSTADKNMKMKYMEHRKPSEGL